MAGKGQTSLPTTPPHRWARGWAALAVEISPPNGIGFPDQLRVVLPLKLYVVILPAHYQPLRMVLWRHLAAAMLRKKKLSRRMTIESCADDR